jgi:mRNA interferase RelE/StbE
MRYTIDIKPVAKRFIKKLPEDLQTRIITALKKLETNPRLPGVIKLHGFENRYRLRVGNYRVIYEIRDAVLLVLVVEVVHRGGAYRKKR